MKTRQTILFAQVILSISILLGGCATLNMDLIYGTWINEKMSPPKTVSTPEGYHDYAKVSDTTPLVTGPDKIVKSWTDLWGNIWYQTYLEYLGINYQTLQKVSKNGTVKEMVAVAVDEFDPKKFPTKVAPGESLYHIWYRAK